MGIEAFVLTLKMKTELLEKLKKIFDENDIYGSVFSYGIDSSDSASIMSVYDNFLPANILIFDFLNIVCKSTDSIVLSAKGIECDFFKFNNRAEYMHFMYDIWEENINNCYHVLGALVINPCEYYKKRFKFKKYYKKL